MEISFPFISIHFHSFHPFCMARRHRQRCPRARRGALSAREAVAGAEHRGHSEAIGGQGPGQPLARLLSGLRLYQTAYMSARQN